MQLVINTFGACLRKQGERFLVRAEDRELAVSAHKVTSILVTTGVLLTTDAVRLAVENNIDIVFLSPEGNPYGRVWQTRLGSTATIRRRQLEASDGPEGLALAQGWVDAKLRQSREFLEELARRRPGCEAEFAATVQALDACRDRLRSLTGTLDERRATVMGLEGTGGRVYFGCLSKLMPEQFRFDGRSRQPAKDAFNATLNYALGVLYSLVERACVCAGLDPFIGFLHTDNYNKKSLVFDVLEPFRILAERTAVLLFTGRRMQADYFEEVPGGVALSAPGRAALLTAFNDRLDKTMRYPVQSRPGKTRNIRQRDVIQHEAHALANLLLGRTDLPRVVETRKLWEETADPPTDLDADDPTLPDEEPLPEARDEEPPC